MSENELNTKILNLLDSLQSRVLGLDMSLRSLVVMQIFDSGSYENALHKASVLKHSLLSIRAGIEQEEFIKHLEQKSFFSSIENLISTIDSVENQISGLISRENQNDK